MPSFTDSTVVSATPAISPPQNTHSKLERIVRGSTSGNPQRLNLMGSIAALTVETTTSVSRQTFITNRIIN